MADMVVCMADMVVCMADMVVCMANMVVCMAQAAYMAYVAYMADMVAAMVADMCSPRGPCVSLCRGLSFTYATLEDSRTFLCTNIPVHSCASLLCADRLVTACSTRPPVGSSSWS